MVHGGQNKRTGQMKSEAFNGGFSQRPKAGLSALVDDR